MMRKLLIATLFLTLIYGRATSQCTPDTSLKSPGIYPTSLPHAMVGKNYNEVVQFRFPKDTTIQSTKLNFDSLRLVKFDSAPAFLSHQCNIDSGFSPCTWKGGGNGCLTFTGTPADSDTGHYHIKVTIKAFFKVFNIPTNRDFTNYLDFVVDGTNLAVADIENNTNNSQGGNFPNPFTTKTDIVFFATKGGNKATIQIYDITGTKIYKTEVNTRPGENRVEFDGTSLPPGLYIYAVCSGNDCITRRMLKNQ